MKNKYKKIIEDSENNGIPIFVLTAKDVKSLRRLIEYRDDCADDCSNEHYQGIEEKIDEFVEWQRNNPDKIKFPD